MLTEAEYPCNIAVGDLVTDSERRTEDSEHRTDTRIDGTPFVLAYLALAGVGMKRYGKIETSQLVQDELGIVLYLRKSSPVLSKMESDLVLKIRRIHTKLSVSGILMYDKSFDGRKWDRQALRIFFRAKLHIKRMMRIHASFGKIRLVSQGQIS